LRELDRAASALLAVAGLAGDDEVLSLMLAALREGNAMVDFIGGALVAAPMANLALSGFPLTQFWRCHASAFSRASIMLTVLAAGAQFVGVLFAPLAGAFYSRRSRSFIWAILPMPLTGAFF
jgi:hypothetical protein